jgi:hypothetical protein
VKIKNKNFDSEVKINSSKKSETMKKLSLILVFSFLVSALGFQSCTQENDASQAPKLPQPQMMLMDFNGFDTVDPDSRSFSNWFHAAVNVYFWTRTVAEVIQVPVVAFVAALHQDAVYQGNDTWMWTFTVNENGEEYVVELFGTLDLAAEEVDWSMNVSKTGVFEDFPWVTGSTAFDESYSRFMLSGFQDEDAGNFAPMDFLMIEYNRELNTDLESIRYTVMVPGDPAAGSYIQYGKTANEEFPVFYDIYLTEENNTTNIEYNPQTRFGRVMDPKRFHDNEWHCWDGQGNDIICQ